MPSDSPSIAACTLFTLMAARDIAQTVKTTRSVVTYYHSHEMIISLVGTVQTQHGFSGTPNRCHDRSTPTQSLLHKWLASLAERGPFVLLQKSVANVGLNYITALTTPREVKPRWQTEGERVRFAYCKIKDVLPRRYNSHKLTFHLSL